MNHSLELLNQLYEFDDFMESIGTMIDMGCGDGYALEWWTTRTTRDEVPLPLNIKCFGVDIPPSLPNVSKRKNLSYISQNFEEPLKYSGKFDVLWCHDAFQYAINPLSTLANWYNVLGKGGMMILSVPQTTNIEFNAQAFDQPSGCYFNWTTVSLIHALAVSGFDCAGGFFQKDIDRPWINAIVYKSDHAPLDPRNTSWYDLMDKGLLPDSACKSIFKYGYLRQRDLVLPWLDKSLQSFAQL